MTRELLRDLILYRTRGDDGPSNPDPIQRMVRKMSEDVRESLDISENDKLIVGDTKALEKVLKVLYQEPITDVQCIFNTICLFTYIAEVCNDLSEDSIPLMTDNVIVVLKSSTQGQRFMSLVYRMYRDEKVMGVAKSAVLCAVCLTMFGLFLWKIR